MNKKHTKIGSYKIIRRIGHGNFAKVDLAVHELLNIKVAIKIISRKKATFQKNFNKFLDEIEIYQTLSHRNIVKLFDVVKSEHSLYLVMEYAPCGDLYTILNVRTKFSEAEARHYFRQMIAALIYSHSMGFAHRDLKLENVFVDESNDIKIGDFGLAGRLKPSMLMATSCGSLRYAAPEILKGKLYSGELADVWSCGVILFTFLAGYHPFEDEVYVTLLQKIKRSNYTLPSDISPESVDLIRKTLQADCNRRITMSEIMCHPWMTYTSFPKYIDYKLIKIQSMSTRPHRTAIDMELIQELAKKPLDDLSETKEITNGVHATNGTSSPDSPLLGPSHSSESASATPPSLSDLALKVITNEECSFVLAYNLVKFDRHRQARILEKSKKTVSKKHVFTMGFLRDVFADPGRGERFHRTFRAYTIDLFNDYERNPWRIGLNFFSNLKKIIRTFIKAATAESVRLEVVSAVEYRFRCFPLGLDGEKTDEALIMQVFQNSSDEYVLDFVNETMSNLRFIMLSFKLFKRMKV